MSKKTPRPSPLEAGLGPFGVDTHAHLDLPKFEKDLPEVLERARKAGVAAIGQVFLGPRAYEENRSLFEEAPDVFFLLGQHPSDAHESPDDLLEATRRAFREDGRLRALGEIGLDFYWDRAPRDVQEEVFRSQLELARELDVPVAIHCRDAFEETLRVLDDTGFDRRPLLWHCFGGDAAMAREIAARGWHVSIPGPVTFRKNEALAGAVAELGPERLVVETDCPFLAPEPWRGRRNEPAFAVFTALRVAGILDLEAQALWKRLGDNARDFFGLPAI